ncbi:hypothetical protein OC835_000787 [Tilletia horrida]|nr:hypothetical protein OC835_000787 [Tilletia horrida]
MSGSATCSGSQLCINLIEPELRTAYTVAYKTAKEHAEAGTLPDWEAVWYQNCLTSYDPQVRVLIRKYFDAVIHAYLHRASGASTASSGESSSTHLATRMVSPSTPRALGPSRAFNCSSTASPHSSVAPTSGAREAPLTLSSTPRKAVAQGGEWRGFEYRGVVRWRKGGVEEKVIAYSEWCEEHDEQGARGGPRTHKTKATGAGAAKIGTGPKPSRARQYDAYRERWECRTCLSQLHEGVGRTGNLTKHRAKCDAAAAAGSKQ